MAEYEIARVDVIFQDDKWLADALPAAKFWQPFSQDAGDMAFQNKPHLSTSHFSSAITKADGTKVGGGMYKYNFWLSMNANGQEVKVYSHCGCLHSIFVRQAPSLRVYAYALQSIGVGETTHIITLSSAQPIFGNSIIFEKEFGNDGSDITLGQILPVARCHLIEGNHLTYAGKLEVIFEGMNITTKLNTVLVKRFGSNEPRKKRKTSR